VHVQGGAVLTGGAYIDNHATDGNGGAVNVNNNLSISGTLFSDNTSGDQGGAVTQWNAPWAVTISGAYFTDNTAYSMGGGAYIGGSLTLTSSTFTGNKVDSLASHGDVYGGGLYAKGALSVDGATFTGNRTLCATPCSFNCGGGIYSDLRNSTVIVSNSTFDGNKGWFGGGISGYTLNVTHSTFKNSSTGGYGGGIYAETLEGDDLLFQDNSVVNAGGAVSASQATLTHTRFIHNSAQNGGAIWDYSTFSGSNLLFERNVAYGNGAIMFMRANATASLYNATIAQPTQGTGPAIYLEAGAVLDLYNSIVNNYTNAITLSGSGSTLNEDYNLYYNNGYDIVQGVGSIVNSGGHTTGAQSPGFVNPAGGDYHLTPSSHAIGAGHNYGLTDDLEGRPRLAGRNDVGAFQFAYLMFTPMVVK
jgi:predicted outer membrane repeat protein